ncbi:hypothetical protein WJX73_008102 [Symbiochloris irregularis]|uniref:F-box domain-containing protein n=1 Tax=Symbiochloris irregularis TaxID=706552 RepID=A0AAW1P116_9CHLO
MSLSKKTRGTAAASCGQGAATSSTRGGADETPTESARLRHTRRAGNLSSDSRDRLDQMSWAFLPGDVLQVVCDCLSSQGDRASCRLVCSSWSKQVLHGAKHLHIRADMTQECVAFLTTKLPSLRNLTLWRIGDLSLVQPLTGLTSLTLGSRNMRIEDFTPLAALPKLTKLDMEGIHLAQRLYFDSLTQLKNKWVSDLASIFPGAVRANPAFQLQSLCLSIPMEKDYMPLTCLTGLRLLAITGSRGLCKLFGALQPLTNLQVLSVAGAEQKWVPGMGHAEDTWTMVLEALLCRHSLLQVLDVRHSHIRNQRKLLALPALRLLVTDAKHGPDLDEDSSEEDSGDSDDPDRAEDDSRWDLLRHKDLSETVQMTKYKQKRLGAMILHKTAGLPADAHLMDEADLQLLDDSWIAHVRYSVLDPLPSFGKAGSNDGSSDEDESEDDSEGWYTDEDDGYLDY